VVSLLVYIHVVRRGRQVSLEQDLESGTKNGSDAEVNLLSMLILCLYVSHMKPHPLFLCVELTHIFGCKVV